MKKLFVFFVFFARLASAQAIYQYPYDTTVVSYVNANYPLVSAQCHWRPANSNTDTTNTPQLMSPQIGHTHMEVNFPIYAELTGDITFPFDIMLFHVDGGINPLESPYGSFRPSDVKWNTPTGAPPVMQGDPNGLVMWSGTITIRASDVAMYFKHGWFQPEFGVHTLFNNGSQARTKLEIPIYSMIDPSQPESNTHDDAEKTEISTHCVVGSAVDTFSGAFGDNIVQYNSYLPILAPITAAIPNVQPQLYGYGGGGLPAGTAMTRFDMNLHLGIPGTLIQSAPVPVGANVFLNSPFDPSILGMGTYKVAAIWQQDSSMGSSQGITANEQVSSLLVVSATVGMATQPPTPITETFMLMGANCNGSIIGTSLDNGKTFTLSTESFTCK